jgi:peptidoglycan/xylan/chitin deacetylase (PgdA/CDA1 family)
MEALDALVARGEARPSPRPLDLRSLLRKVVVLVAVACVSLMPAAAWGSATPVVSKADAAATVYSLSYRPELYVIEGGLARAISYSEWQQMGFPRPEPAPTRFVKYRWAAGIYAVTPWSAAEVTWQWDLLTYEQWRRAGFPAPQTVPWIQGSYLYKWATSPDIGVRAPDGSQRWLTWSEWAAMDFRSYDHRVNEGFVKLTWDPTIAKMDDLANWKGHPIGWAQWRDANFAKPRGYQRFPGDRFTRYLGSPTIYYSGLTANRAITYSEWAAAGFPAPTIVDPRVDCARVACVALTFDDGPSTHTDRLIDSLTRLEVPATFFVIGEQVGVRPSVVRRLQASGQSVQNHTFSHPQLTTLSAASQLSQVTRTDDALAAAGVRRSTQLRPPYGSWNAATRTLGKPLIMWSVDPRDWDGKSASAIRSHVSTYTRAGDIVLMHDRVSATVDAVPGIVADLRAKGFTLVSVDTLIPNLQPGDVAYSRTNVVRSTASAQTDVLTRDGRPVRDEAPFHSLEGAAP